MLQYFIFFSLSNGDVDCWEGSEDSGPRRQIILPKSVDLTDGVGGVALHNIHAATLPPYNKADAPPVNILFKVFYFDNRVIIEQNNLIITHYSWLIIAASHAM